MPISPSSSGTPLDNLGLSNDKAPLLEGKEEQLANTLLKSEKCELRVEGMTCGACVEVRDLSSSSR